MSRRRRFVKVTYGSVMERLDVEDPDAAAIIREYVSATNREAAGYRVQLVQLREELSRDRGN